MIVEIGDTRGFVKAASMLHFWGVVPGENSSGDAINRQGISKVGNAYLRKLLTKAAQVICQGRVGYKSKTLKARQKGNDHKVIIYVDKVNKRLRRKYYRMIRREKKRNVAVTATNQELACFIWGMMTENIGGNGIRQASHDPI